jgi:DNA-directed RNA polymerase specialized sigma24 family protein
LPEPEQYAIRGIYFEGREVGEIAADLSRSPAAVRGLLHRAYKRLATCLGSSSQWLHRF